MSVPIVCNGCGGRLTVPDDYTRNKMQCPDCGVMCVIPPRTAAKKKAPAPPTSEEPRFDEEEAAATTAFTDSPLPSGKGLITCRQCGERVRAPARKPGKRRQCPVCGADLPTPATTVKTAQKAASIPPPPDEFAGATIDQDPDSGNPYGTADPGARRCPDCTEQLAPGTAVCVRCGFDLRAGRKVVKEYQRREQAWDSGLSLRTRVILFLLCQAAAFTAGFAVLGVSIHKEMVTFLCSWMVYTTMTAFLFGTFDHLHLKRHKSGKVDLTRTWRVGFWPLPSREIDLRAYSSVTCGAAEYANLWDWLIFCILLSPGIIPALLFWYFAIHKTEYFVGLCGEHGLIEEKVYRGRDKERMAEIQQTMRDALTA